MGVSITAVPCEEAELGAIAPGYRADLVAFSSNFEVINTWVGGRGLGG